MRQEDGDWVRKRLAVNEKWYLAILIAIAVTWFLTSNFDLIVTKKGSGTVEPERVPTSNSALPTPNPINPYEREIPDDLTTVTRWGEGCRRFVQFSQEASTGMYTPGEMSSELLVVWQHFNKGSVERNLVDQLRQAVLRYDEDGMTEIGTQVVRLCVDKLR